MKIQVPEPYLAGLKALLELEDANADELVRSLDQAQWTLDRQAVANSLEPRLHGVPPDDILEIVSSLISLCSAVEILEVGPSEFVCEVVADLRSQKEELELGDEALDGAEGRLNTLLRHPGLSNVAKARSIMRDCAHAYCKGRILTDVRPIFSDGPDGPPTAAVIVHTMRITYHERNRLRDFYLTLDSSELRQLKDLIDRAESKQKSLEATLQSAKLVHVGAG